MKVLVTGANGQLGYDVVNELRHRNIKCIGTGRQQFDITDYAAAKQFIEDYLPDAVIHCGAYTAVDRAEDEPELCYKVNVIGTENIAKICKKINAKMMYISTDYVFDGTKEGVYEVDDIPNPQNMYGKTKLEGEVAVQRLLNKYFIVRISWVFGSNGNNFVKTMLRLGQEKEVIDVVSDQVGSPTYTVDLSKLLVDMIPTDKYGIYHAANEGVCSWAEFAEKIFEISKINVKINHISTQEYLSKAKRPKNSRLSKEKLMEPGFEKLPSWENAVARYMDSVI
ncbi:MAG: dTDP-4-dehydrorhamnose reductase [Phascolarctobacterium sp.]|uniref:dTDP-4-dehydrorhamnose reductase n=1 Tax=Phascolarctobacterium sp. TaxID=2049039 RepID=UPI0025CB7C74|nr:dTDP-4-dehydrorhamnose reductase [Phascolarctobacterium sp.]MCC8158702.1 dTDP-4-dehydrorhamnose reductase [Phascolarctobacterium sp.]MCC8174695.1 dTDP-4-dehydrorhamnose reductase [Odoribacter sp.]